jgi:hypothetical protein
VGPPHPVRLDSPTALGALGPSPQLKSGSRSQRKSGARSPWSRTASAKAMRSYCWKSAKRSSTYRRRACKVSPSAGVVLELGEPPPRPELEQIAADERLTVLSSGAQALLDGGCAEPKNAPMSAAKTVAVTSPSTTGSLLCHPTQGPAGPAPPHRPPPEPAIAARRLTHTAPPRDNAYSQGTDQQLVNRRTRRASLRHNG